MDSLHTHVDSIAEHHLGCTIDVQELGEDIFGCIDLYGYSCDIGNAHPEIEAKTSATGLLKPTPILPDNKSASSTSNSQAKNKELLASTSNTHPKPTQMSKVFK